MRKLAKSRKQIEIKIRLNQRMHRKNHPEYPEKKTIQVAQGSYCGLMVMDTRAFFFALQ